MKVGVKLPYFSAGRGEQFRRFIQVADELGFDSVWVGDHFVIPDDIDISNYEYLWRFSPDTTDLFPNKHFLEAITTLAFAAGVSSRLEVGVGVLVVPMRHPVQLAAELATLDVLSDGRLIAGVGTGWLAEEFAALGRPYGSRGRSLDEGIAAMRGLWTEVPFGFEGAVWAFEDVHCLPQPPRPGGVPIWIGGDSDRALKRAARLGDGWQPVELAPEEFGERSSDLDELLLEEGREPGDVVRSVSTRLPLSGGDRARAAEIVDAYEDAGCDHLVVYSTASRSIEENIERMYHLAEIAVSRTQPQHRVHDGRRRTGTDGTDAKTGVRPADGICDSSS